MRSKNWNDWHLATYDINGNISFLYVRFHISLHFLMIWQQFKDNICAFQFSKDFWVCANIKCAFTSPTLCYDANWGIFSCVSIRYKVDSRNLNPSFWHEGESKDLNKEITWLSTLLRNKREEVFKLRTAKQGKWHWDAQMTFKCTDEFT